jgi:hypothetical protein
MTEFVTAISTIHVFLVMTTQEAAVAISATVVVFLALTTIIAVVASGFFSTQRAKASVAREEAYRKLAEESAQALDRTAAQLERHTAAVDELRAGTAELERMLKEVE